MRELVRRLLVNQSAPMENTFPIIDVIYAAWDALFHHQIKHKEESWKYDAQQSIFYELWGVSSGWWCNTV